MWVSFNFENKEQAQNILNNSNSSYIDRINAGWSLLGGKKFKTDHINFFNTDPAIDDLDFYIEQVEKISNPFVANLVKNAYYAQVENIFLGIPVIYDSYQKEIISTANEKMVAGKTIENMYVKEDVLYHKETGLELISCGMDGHTREGKSVYYNFLKSQQDFTKYLNAHKIPFEKHIDVFLHCMFRVEGHEVNKRVYFPMAVTVMRDCEQEILNFKAGSDSLNFLEIKNILIETMPKINQMKKDSLNKVLTQSYIKNKF